MQTTHPLIPLLAAVLLAAVLSTPARARSGAALPNVVFILADDIGWADPGRYHERAGRMRGEGILKIKVLRL